MGPLGGVAGGASSGCCEGLAEGLRIDTPRIMERPVSSRRGVDRPSDDVDASRENGGGMTVPGAAPDGVACEKLPIRRNSEPGVCGVATTLMPLPPPPPPLLWL